jgi:hypothetical protein
LRAGPDPDDVKALLIAAILHNQGHVWLRAVVCNGGSSARDRARLARCVLDHVGRSRTGPRLHAFQLGRLNSWVLKDEFAVTERS